MTDDPPAGYLFINGKAMYFDEDGEQLPEYQSDNWMGVHAFLADYPDAEIRITKWFNNRAIHPFPIDESVIDQIKEP